MHLELINERLDQLYAVLQYCSEERKTFTTGERICINIERAALFDRKNYLFQELPLEEVRKLETIPELEEKIHRTLQRMEAENFMAYKTSWFIKEE